MSEITYQGCTQIFNDRNFEACKSQMNQLPDRNQALNKWSKMKDYNNSWSKHTQRLFNVGAEKLQFTH